MRKFFIALSFYTRLPIQIKSEVSEEDFYSSMKCLPVVGLVIGLVLYALWYLLKDVEGQVSAFLLVFLYIWLTGGLHIDGFMDTLDGVLSNRSREETLEIMKDSRVGAFGAIGLLLLVLGYFISYQFVDGYAIIIAPIIGRTGALFSASFSESARKGNSLGKGFMERMGRKERVFGLIFSTIIILLFDFFYLIPFALCMLMSAYFIKYFKNKLGGMTGDTVGMMIELNQIVFLFVSYLTWYFVG